MARPSDVVRIASALPGAVRGGSEERLAFEVEVKGKRRGFCWSWLERVHPKQARVPNLGVLAVRVSGAEEKAALLAGDPDLFFTEPHYNRYPAVLVRLSKVRVPQLRVLIESAWRCVAAPPRKPR
ncbi:MAG: hypothetical protein ABW221_07550 [Vicinamibacteria bacterium]